MSVGSSFPTAPTRGETILGRSAGSGTAAIISWTPEGSTRAGSSHSSHMPRGRTRGAHGETLDNDSGALARGDVASGSGRLPLEEIQIE